MDIIKPGVLPAPAQYTSDPCRACGCVAKAALQEMPYVRVDYADRCKVGAIKCPTAGCDAYLNFFLRSEDD